MSRPVSTQAPTPAVTVAHLHGRAREGKFERRAQLRCSLVHLGPVILQLVALVKHCTLLMSLQMSRSHGHGVRDDSPGSGCMHASSPVLTVGMQRPMGVAAHRTHARDGNKRARAPTSHVPVDLSKLFCVHPATGLCKCGAITASPSAASPCTASGSTDEPRGTACHQSSQQASRARPDGRSAPLTAASRKW